MATSSDPAGRDHLRDRSISAVSSVRSPSCRGPSACAGPVQRPAGTGGPWRTTGSTDAVEGPRDEVAELPAVRGREIGYAALLAAPPVVGFAAVVVTRSLIPKR
ncbi:hypothetical protein ACQPZF_35430 [Actinosynnema sp. CS-041913]|uniref:hypothetical protein n=1 Tax=Actinosynnema sp. CS-041913 TaxID=3239917 RepID=UPI003D9150F0